MTGLPWLAFVVAMLIAIVVGLQVVGAHRWAELIRTLTLALEAGRVDAGTPLASPSRFHVRELDALPVPVQRYFRTVLTDGQPIISGATIEMAGTMNMSTTAEQWKPFTSHQRIITRRPGFIWNARVGMFPGVPARVADSYVAGEGSLLAKLLGLFTVAEAHGGGELARGELMRYLAEAPWYPTALLPSQGVQWQAGDDASATVMLVDGPVKLSLLFKFNQAGLVESVHAESRGAGVGKEMVMLPWDCSFFDYQPHDGMMIPRSGRAAWLRSSGSNLYFRGTVKTLSYDYKP